MRIYIDEAGQFLPPSSPRSLFSLVLALTIPGAVEHDLFYEFLRLRDGWPNQQVEIKGSTLTEKQAAELIRLVLPYDTLVQFVALDTNTHPDGLVDVFKNRQADAVTAHITRQHHPNPIPHLHQLGEAVRAMPNQLFLQTVATWELVIRTIREGTLYYVQRQPSELGDISWIIDRKDNILTQMEDTWSTLILPLSEAEFLKEPLSCLRGADYSQFDARYGIDPATADDEMRSHWDWLESMSTVSPTRCDTFGTDITRLLTEQQSFGDSHSNLGLQLADMLSSILRRALNGNLQESGWGEFGGLLVRQNHARTGIIQLGHGVPTPVLGHARTVWEVLNQKAKSMISDAVTKPMSLLAGIQALRYELFSHLPMLQRLQRTQPRM